MNPQKSPQYVPQSWLEWIWSIYDPDLYIVQEQSYGTTIVIPASSVNTGTIQISNANTYFCYGWRTKGFVSATGAVPTFPYRSGIRNAANNDWTNGQWLSAIVSQDNGAGAVYSVDWMLPREVAQNEILQVTIDNTLNAAQAITVDAVLVGYEVRSRTQKVQRLQ